MSAVDFIAYIALFWLGAGLVTFLVACMVAIWRGDAPDRDWPLGLAICMGAGPCVTFFMIKDAIIWFAEKRRYAKR